MAAADVVAPGPKTEPGATRGVGFAALERLLPGDPETGEIRRLPRVPSGPPDIIPFPFLLQGVSECGTVRKLDRVGMEKPRTEVRQGVQNALLPMDQLLATRATIARINVTLFP